MKPYVSRNFDTNGISAIERYLFYFAVVDVLFLPYAHLLAMTYSQILVFAWFLLKQMSGVKALQCESDLRRFLVFSTFVILCTATSFFFIPSFRLLDGYRENVMRALQMISSFGYLFFFIYVMSRARIRWDVILYLFILYSALWAMIYLLDFPMFLSLKRFFNPYDSFIGFLSDVEGYDYRFSFIWTDPNNISYAICGVFVMLITWKQYNLLPTVLITICTILICVLCRSTGGWLSLVYSVAILGYVQLKKSKKLSPVTRVVYIVLVILVILASIYILLTYILPQEAIYQSVSRLNSKGDDISRLVIWRRLFEDKADSLPLYLFYGTGYQVYVNGSPYNVHNGHFLLIIAYGMIGYIAYMLLLFRKPKNVGLLGYAFLVPFILAITINTYIGEAKAVGLMMFLIAIMRTQAGCLSINSKVHK